MRRNFDPTLASPSSENFIPTTSEFPSLRKEKIDWCKLASVDQHDLNSIGCDVEVLQENLVHVTFCQAEEEFNLKTTLGQKSFFKLFRLAQLLLQYMFISQEYMESQIYIHQNESKNIQQKYNELKEKFKQQVEEAKKIKTNNRNMRETIKYLSSVTASSGAVEQLKCPLCSKSFRGHDFLNSHIWRKHPEEAATVLIPESVADQDIKQNVLEINHCQPSSSKVMDGPPLNLPGNIDSGLGIASFNLNLKTNDGLNMYSGRTASTINNNHDIETYKINEIEKKYNDMNESLLELVKKTENQNSILKRDIDEKVSTIKQICEEKKHVEMKYESYFESFNQKINDLTYNQSLHNEKNLEPNEQILNFIRKQQDDIELLKQKLDTQIATNTTDKGEVFDIVSEEVNVLKKQLSKERYNHELSIKQLHNDLKLQYENTLDEEKQKVTKILENLNANQILPTVSNTQTVASTSLEMVKTANKPPPSPKVNKQKSNINRKGKMFEPIEYVSEIMPNKEKDVSDESNREDVQNVMNGSPQSKSKSSSHTSPVHVIRPPIPHPRTKPLNVEYFGSPQSSSTPKITKSSENKSNTYGDISESEFSDSNDTSRWTNNSNEKRHVQTAVHKKDDNKRLIEVKNNKSETSDDDDINTSDDDDINTSDDDDGSDDNATSDDVDDLSPQITSNSSELTKLMKEKPHLWSQMRNATNEVLTDKLQALGIKPSEKRLKTVTLNSCLSKLKQERIPMLKKYENFYTLKKQIKNNLEMKLDENLSEQKTPQKSTFDEMKENKPKSNFMSRMAKSMKSQVRKKSLEIHTSVSKSFVNVENRNVFSKNKVKKISSNPSVKSSESFNKEDSSDSELSNNVEVVIHNEGKKRSLKEPLLVSPRGVEPSRSYFENKTYGKPNEKHDSVPTIFDHQSFSDTESDDQYENLKIQNLPQRKESLPTFKINEMNRIQYESDSSEEEVYRPMKLKKPTGKMVSHLSKSIESQLTRRVTDKPVGGIDIMSGTIAGPHRSNFKESDYDRPSISDTSNTIKTSMWGSSSTVYEPMPRNKTTMMLNTWESDDLSD